ncbi:MAG: right-handed parallel beta-helix repeat-containing protein, partial [Phycisphaerales bacterium JB038]
MKHTRGVLARAAAAAALAAVAALTHADVLLVPDQYATIQAAIDAALDGDVIEIADGVYTGAGNKNLDFGGRAITVRSAAGDPECCIIDCEQDGRGFYFHSGETPDARLEGLTIRNGYVDRDSVDGRSGGGIYCEASSPTIVSCWILNNTAIERNAPGGGVHCNNNSNVQFESCLISGNYGYIGGGVCAQVSSPNLTNCVLSANSAYYGGGISLYQGVMQITACTIQGNTADDVAGGIACSSEGNAQCIDCLIADNVAGQAAG